MEMIIILLAIVYVILLVLVFKSTWDFAVSIALAGSSGIVLPIILFVLMLLVVGLVMGIVSIVKLLAAKHKKTKAREDGM